MATYRKYFKRVLRKYFPNDATIVAAIDAEFVWIQPDFSFAKQSKNPMDRRMEIAGYFLATIKILDRKSVDFEQIRVIVVEIAHEYVKPKNRFHAFLKKFPAKLVGSQLGHWFLRIFKKKVKNLGHTEGFAVDILTDKAETLGFGYGFNIIECGICKLFKKHNCQKFASILCEVDYITSNLAGLTLIRTGTIANGAKICDFRFQKS